MRNIYFIEFGNYDGTEVKNKFIFPVSAKDISSCNDEKLCELMKKIGCNCIVSKSSFTNSNKFSEMYDLERKEIVPYNVNYILISCIDNNIYTENFESFIDARNSMIKEVINTENIYDYENFCEDNGNYEGCDVNILNTRAYSKKNCWKIIIC